MLSSDLQGLKPKLKIFRLKQTSNVTRILEHKWGARRFNAQLSSYQLVNNTKELMRHSKQPQFQLTTTIYLLHKTQNQQLRKLLVSQPSLSPE